MPSLSCETAEPFLEVECSVSKVKAFVEPQLSDILFTSSLEYPHLFHLTQLLGRNNILSYKQIYLHKLSEPYDFPNLLHISHMVWIIKAIYSFKLYPGEHQTLVYFCPNSAFRSYYHRKPTVYPKKAQAFINTSCML